MLDKVKLALRISGTVFDLEIQDLIDAAKLDLQISGVVKVDEEDALIQRAIIVYCKANFGYDNNEAERFQKSYDMLKQHLSLAGDYNAWYEKYN